MDIKKFLKLYLPLFIYMFFMWHLSSTAIIIPKFLQIRFSDKIFHFFEYAIFGFLLVRAVSQGKKPEKRFILAIGVIALALVWGIIDEVHQSYVMSRQSSMFDVIADCFGAGFGQLFIGPGEKGSN